MLLSCPAEDKHSILLVTTVRTDIMSNRSMHAEKLDSRSTHNHAAQRNPTYTRYLADTLVYAQIHKADDMTRETISIYSLQKTAWGGPCVAIWDTGNDANWISSDMLCSVGEPLQRRPSSGTEFQDMRGNFFACDEEVLLSWKGVKSDKFYKTWFLVISNEVPYEVIMGKHFVVTERLRPICRLALIALARPPTKGKYIHMSKTSRVADIAPYRAAACYRAKSSTAGSRS